MKSVKMESGISSSLIFNNRNEDQSNEMEIKEEIICGDLLEEVEMCSASWFINDQRSKTINLLKQALESLWKIVYTSEVEETIIPIRFRLSKVLRQVEGFDFGANVNPIGDATIKEEPEKKLVIVEVTSLKPPPPVKSKPRTKREAKSKPTESKKSRMRRDTNMNLSLYCDFCGKVFSNKQKLVHHIWCHRIDPCICEICGKVCKSNTALKKHLTSHTNQEHPRSKCPQCDRILLTSNIKKHIRIFHQKIRKFSW
jgi:hypothetical protein